MTSPTFDGVLTERRSFRLDFLQVFVEQRFEQPDPLVALVYELRHIGFLRHAQGAHFYDT